MSARRDVSPIVQVIRDFLLKRKTTNFLRFQDEISRRTQPPPNIPEGPNSKLSCNYYYTRDARRLVKPDVTLFEGSKVLKLPEGGEKPTTVIHRVPGRVKNWDM